MNSVIGRCAALYGAFKALALAVCLAGSANAGSSKLIAATVVRVIDGDTVVVGNDAQVQNTLRLAGIDAPEKQMPYGPEAKEALAILLIGKAITYESTKTDRYGRPIATVYLERKNINLHMVQQGLAWHYTKYAAELGQREAMIFANAERLAREAKKGLWGQEEPMAPWEWRILKITKTSFMQPIIDVQRLVSTVCGKCGAELPRRDSL